MSYQKRGRPRRTAQAAKELLDMGFDYEFVARDLGIKTTSLDRAMYREMKREDSCL